jgi:hypothetical protein
MPKRQLFYGLSFVAAGLTVAPAIAQEATPICQNAGNVYQVGDFACIAACHGARRLARCDQLADAATWTYVSDVCPSAWIVPPPPGNASQIPTVAAMSPIPGPLKISEFSPQMSLHMAMLRLEQPTASSERSR